MSGRTDCLLLCSIVNVVLYHGSEQLHLMGVLFEKSGRGDSHVVKIVGVERR